jgi:hypothetical protein
MQWRAITVGEGGRRGAASLWPPTLASTMDHFMKILGRWEPHPDGSEIRYRAK